MEDNSARETRVLGAEGLENRVLGWGLRLNEAFEGLAKENDVVV